MKTTTTCPHCQKTTKHNTVCARCGGNLPPRITMSHGLPLEIHPGWVAQEIHGSWYVFPRLNYDATTGRYFGALIAGATSLEDAKARFHHGRAV